MVREFDLVPRECGVVVAVLDVAAFVLVFSELLWWSLLYMPTPVELVDLLGSLMLWDCCCCCYYCCDDELPVTWEVEELLLVAYCCCCCCCYC